MDSKIIDLNKKYKFSYILIFKVHLIIPQKIPKYRQADNLKLYRLLQAY